MLFTPTQREVYLEIIRLAPLFPILVIQGEKGTGKDLIIKEYLREKQVIHLDLCQMSMSLSLKPENFYSYIKSLIGKSGNKLIYIRHWDRIKEILEDYGIRNRYFPRYILTRLVEEGMHIIISSETEIRLDTSKYWTIRLKLGSKDTVDYLQRYFQKEEIKELIPLVSKASLETLEQARVFSSSSLEEARVHSLDKFKDAITHLIGSRLNTKERIPEVVPTLNLIGMEGILEEMEKSIICPMKDTNGEIPLKKGIVISGPPGTGKTSIGRWLAHQIRGKFYLVDGTSGVNGNTFIESVNYSLEQAAHNSPGVVFIDDVDLIFEYADTYRSFLTLLDGIENKCRSKVCVIVTCMDISKIPSSLIRGGRLELCIETQLPTYESRKKLLQLGWNRIQEVLTNKGLGSNIEYPLEGVARKTVGWNCADINRYIDDLLRAMVYSNSNKKLSFEDISNGIISVINKQYTVVRRPEERDNYKHIYS